MFSIINMSCEYKIIYRNTVGKIVFNKNGNYFYTSKRPFQKNPFYLNENFVTLHWNNRKKIKYKTNDEGKTYKATNFHYLEAINENNLLTNKNIVQMVMNGFNSIIDNKNNKIVEKIDDSQNKNNIIIDHNDNFEKLICVGSHTYCIWKDLGKYYNVDTYNKLGLSGINYLKNVKYPVLIWAKEAHIYKKKLFSDRKSNNLPVYCVERGCLPDSIFFDSSGWLFDSIYYKKENWDNILQDNQLEQVNNYIKDLRYNKSQTLEIQKNEKLVINRNKFKSVIFVPLQCRQDLTIKIGAHWIKSVETFVSIVTKLSEDFKDVLFLIKNHPIDPFWKSPNKPNIQLADSYHYKDCLEQCDKVMVINSSVGLQAMCWEKFCGYCGHSFYDIDGVNAKLNNVEDIKKFIKGSLKVTNYGDVQKFIYYLRYKFYTNVKLTKKDPHKLRTTGCQFFEKPKLIIHNDTKNYLKINNVMFSDPKRDGWVFGKILKIYDNLNILKFNISCDVIDDNDIFIYWRMHNFGNYEKKYQKYKHNKKFLENGIVYIHDEIKFILNIRERVSFKKREKLFRQFNNFFCTSISQMETINKNMNNSSIVYNPLSILNTFDQQNTEKIKNKKFQLGWIGKIYKDNCKGFSILSDLIYKLDENLFEINFFTENLNFFTKEWLKKNDNHIKIHQRNINDVTSFLNIDLFLITSFSEGSPIPLYEIVKFNKCLISTDCGNVRSIIHPQCIVKHDSSEFAKKINEFSKNKNLLDFYAQQNKKNLDSFSISWENHLHILSRYINYLKNKKTTDFLFIYYNDIFDRKCKVVYEELKKNYNVQTLNIKENTNYKNTLINFLNKTNPLYIIFWNGYFNGYNGKTPNQLITKSILKEYYKNTMDDKIIYLENGLYDQKDTFIIFKNGPHGLSNISKLSSLYYPINLKNEKSLPIKNGYYDSTKKIEYENENYALIILQKENDTTIRCCSPFFKKNIIFIDHIKKIMKNSQMKIVVKVHPLDKNLDHYKQNFKNLEFIHEKYTLKSVLKKSSLVFCINSTVANEALIMKKKVITYGTGLFSNKNVTFEANPESTFDEILNFKFDEKFCNIFHNGLRYHTFSVNDFDIFKFKNILGMYWNIIPK